MRAVFFLIATALLPGATFAADLDYGGLRGTQYGSSSDTAPADWSGVYVGGFAGASQSNIATTHATDPLLATALRTTLLESEHQVSGWLRIPAKDKRDTGFGGFAGYNYQTGEVVLGIEADYTRANLKQSGQDAITRTVGTSNAYVNYVALTGQTTTDISDIGTLRFRVGYTMGPVLPFVTAGIAVAQIKSSASITRQISGYSTTELAASQANFNQYGYPLQVAAYGYSSFNPLTAAGVRAAPLTDRSAKSTVAVGFAAGGGVEFMLSQNVFLRGEYQYAFFDDDNGRKFNLNTVRGGAGVKF